MEERFKEQDKVRAEARGIEGRVTERGIVRRVQEGCIVGEGIVEMKAKDGGIEGSVNVGRRKAGT